MFKIVNGYACTSGCDVAAAKKGKDPENPTGNPVKEKELAEADALSRGQDPAEVRTGAAGRVGPAGEAVETGRDPRGRGRDPRGRGGDPGEGRGALLDLYA